MTICVALQDGFTAIESHLKQLERSDDMLNRYRVALEDIASFYNSRSLTEYSFDTNEEYRSELNAKFINHLISERKYRQFTRVAYMLDSYYQGAVFSLTYSRGTRYKVQLNAQFQSLLDEFQDYLDETLSMNSIPGYISIVRDFFYYLETSDIDNIRGICDSDIIGFIENCHEYRPASMNNVCCALKKILDFLSLKGCVVSREIAKYKAAPTRREIYPAFDSDELHIILATPDRTTIAGKRDYAIIILASFTGFRAIDIANLQFSNYDPIHRTINLIQHKTGTLIGMPIPNEVIEAMNDYIHNGRPDIQSEYIFLTLCKPYRKLADKASVRNILIKQLKKSGLGYAPKTGRGFHAFRRTMGKWLLSSSANPEMISQILGHRDGEVLKRYLPLSPDSMRECALDFTTAPLRAEVFK